MNLKQFTEKSRKKRHFLLKISVCVLLNTKCFPERHEFHGREIRRLVRKAWLEESPPL